MFTLKIARTGSAEGSATWITGVARVHLIEIAPKSADPGQWQSYKEHVSSDFTSFLEVGRDVALLSIEFVDSRQEYVMCGRSWLLGPNGDSIERITP